MISKLRQYLQKTKPVFAKATDMLFPPRCPACAESVLTQGSLCSECWRDMHFITDPMCHSCGLPFEYKVEGHAVCGQCMETPPAFTRAVSVFRYDDKSRAQILAFKFHDRTQLAPLFGGWLARTGNEFLLAADVIIPVPLHYRRLLARRYNQSALLAHMVADHAKVPLLHHSLQRKRATTAQSGLSRKGREDNMRGAFLVPKRERSLIKGKTVLLIDDVMTTGATLNACSRVLRGAGAKDIYALTLARTVVEH